ncbi:hypothetical protein DL770_001414 [Monosporascus sp. CRB-9-2]|nr:hypothetical protein DL770_001414 [Monosporascus sp. CRB-9-2]
MTTTKNLGPITTSLALPESCANELDTVYKIPRPTNHTALHTAAVVLRWDLILNIGDRQYDYQCQTTSYYPWEETLGCFNAVTSSLTTTWTVVEISGEKTASVLSEGHPGGLNAFSIQVRFQSSDFASSTSTISLSAERPTSTVSTGLAAETSNDSSNSNAGQNTGNAAGAAVGITVGVFVALLAIVGAIFIFMRRRRRELNRPQGPQPLMHEMGCDTETKFYEAPGKPVLDPRFPTYELDSRPVAVKNQGRH